MMPNPFKLNPSEGVFSMKAAFSSRPVKRVLIPFRIFALVVLLIQQTLPMTAHAQEARIFVLPARRLQVSIKSTSNKSSAKTTD